MLPVNGYHHENANRILTAATHPHGVQIEELVVAQVDDGAGPVHRQVHRHDHQVAVQHRRRCLCIKVVIRVRVRVGVRVWARFRVGDASASMTLR